jgi:type IV secretory pathway VirB10-like protein
MRAFPGETAKIALVALASVSTVGLLVYLAEREPSRPPLASATRETPKSVPPSFELRRAPAEPVERSGLKETAATTAPPAALEPQPPSEPPVEADENPALPAAALEKAVERDGPIFEPRSKHRTARTDATGAAPARRSAFGRAVKSRASFGPLPNRKCGEHEEMDRQESHDPISEFIDGF